MTALPPMTERSLPSTWPDSMQRTILKRNPMMADCRVSVTAHSSGDSSGTRMFQGTLTNCNSAVNSGWRVQPSACYSGGGKESTRITSTLHFPASDTQGRLCRSGKEEFQCNGCGLNFSLTAFSLLVRSTKLPMVQIWIIFSTIPLMFQNY